jgi:mannitol-specific phosphotransferase system IIBC component
MTTKQTAGVSSLVAVPVSVLISFLTTTATVEVKAERNEKDIKEVSQDIQQTRDQAIRNEERLKSLKETQTEIKALLEQINRNTKK